ncbi:MAG: valine--tRNA ligase [Desulfohalobiaceae bacterium]|nr:valine--tRNA ligase [Desulfohalobiaceae bacterium]
MGGQVELSKGYESRQVEERWRDFWDREGTFTADPESEAPAFSMVIPPPNVTGSLHMGHALNITLQDVLCRYKRQNGYNVLWVPGTDHAGIATQNVVERALAQEGISREELGREEFVRRVWQWREEYGDKILNQVKRMGASVDWSRQRFTMDEGLSLAVREVFVRLFEEGLIYRGDYIINWCPRCQTALADLEVEYEEQEGGIYHIAYPLAGGGEVVVATTRPETMLGDTAVAVHPEDERFRHLVGGTVRLPLVDRDIPVVADTHVDTSFGTGCLKVTPAHDPNDFDLGERHGLASVRVINDTGHMTEDAGLAYQGLDRHTARERVVADLREQGVLRQVEKYTHNVGRCYRCSTDIEPLISKQWFVATGALARAATDAVRDGSTRFFPEHWLTHYYDWMDNIRDWCISRQIWWGHRIPAWTCGDCGELIVSREDPQACPSCGSQNLAQDEDVLDTWFSSALWPFSTLGWPGDTKDLRTFYPTSVLVTGFDIIFFWVARMMMMGIHFREQVPFEHVYIHALVRDEEGQKMSKSKGNVIDPVEVIEEYGADALRFTLAILAAMGRDVKLSKPRIEGYRHFINKIWNAARFALMNLQDPVPEVDFTSVKSFSHRYILQEMERIKQEVAQAVEGYRFNDAAHDLYQFLWHTYCDWYLEMIKPELFSDDEELRLEAQACLHKSFTELLVLLHPFVPFVTQELWDHFPGIEEKNLARVPYPEMRPECRNEELPAWMDFLQQVVVSVRNVRSELELNPGRRLTLLARMDGERAAFLERNRRVVSELARLEELRIDAELTPPGAAASNVVDGCELFVPLEGVVDFRAEVERLDKQLGKVDKDLSGSERKLANEDFVNKAPADVVDKERQRRDELRQKRDKLSSLREKLAQYQQDEA